jgi:hypothetical protein
MLPHDYDPLSFAALSSPDFWLYPIARNPGARLPRFGIDSVYYIGTQHGWAVSSDNVTIHTSNGGASWHAGDAGEEAHYYPAPWFWMESCVLLWLAGIAARRRN